MTENKEQIQKRDDADRDLGRDESALEVLPSFTPVSIDQYDVELLNGNADIKFTIVFTVKATKSGPGPVPKPSPTSYGAFKTGKLTNLKVDKMAVSVTLVDDVPALNIRSLKGQGIKVQHGS